MTEYTNPNYPSDILIGEPRSVDPLALAFGGRQERDNVRYPVTRLGGDFALQAGVDHPAPQKQPEAIKTRREEVNPNRTFFVQQGRDEGGFRQNWSRWRIVRDGASGVARHVEVIYSEQCDTHGRVLMADKIALYGKDAFNFLKLVGDRNFEAFAHTPRSKPSRFQA